MASMLHVALKVLLGFFVADPPAEPARPAAEGTPPAEVKSIYDLTMKDIDGHDVALSRYKGQVCLIVNVASKCGFTKQYAGLESLFKTHKDRGFVVIGVPANNFGGQEPGTNEEIKAFCTSKYNVSFDMLAKVSVKGEDQCPLYRYLTAHPNKDIAGDVPWNFQKYLIGRDGTVLAKFGPRTAPDDKEFLARIEEALKAGKPAAESAPKTPS